MMTLQRVLELCLFSVSIILLLVSEAHPSDVIIWSQFPSSVTGIEGQSVNMTWSFTMTRNKPWTKAAMFRQRRDFKGLVISYGNSDKKIDVGPAFITTKEMINITSFDTGNVTTFVFTLPNLNKTTDEKRYMFWIRDSRNTNGYFAIGPTTNYTQLIVIGSPWPSKYDKTNKDIHVIGQTVMLN